MQNLHLSERGFALHKADPAQHSGMKSYFSIRFLLTSLFLMVTVVSSHAARRGSSSTPPPVVIDPVVEKPLVSPL